MSESWQYPCSCAERDGNDFCGSGYCNQPGGCDAGNVVEIRGQKYRHNGRSLRPLVSGVILSDRMRHKAVIGVKHWTLDIDEEAGLDGGTADLPVLVAAAVAIGGTQ